MSELEDLHRFSFNSISTLLAVFTISASKASLPIVLTLLIYTISLRLAINPCFIQNYTTVTKFLYVIPLLGTLCMAGVELVVDLKSISPTLAVVVLLLGVMPFMTAIIHHGIGAAEEMPLPVPVRMQDPPYTMQIHSTTA